MLSFILHAGQVLNNFACNDKTRNSRHKRSAARNLPALGALARGARWADAVLAAADRHIVDWRHGRLFGVHNLELADAALAASLFHYKELEISDLKDYLAQRGVSVRR